MRFIHFGSYIIASIGVIAVVTGCSEKTTMSTSVKFLVNPDEPIVITAPTVDSKGSKIEGPWFQFNTSLTNDAPEKLTIVAVLIEVNGLDENGQPEKKETAFTPEMFDFQLSENTECKYSSFGTYDSGASRALYLPNAVADCVRNPLFKIGGAPKGNGRNYRYRVVLKPIGWFGGLDDALDRFDKKVNFYTR